MKLESITCNHCGAPLQVPESANYVTCTHCDRQLAIHRTENSRFTEVVEDLREQVAKLTQQNEIAALDREWEAKKEKFLVSGKDGIKHLPTKAGSLIGAIAIMVVGGLWIVMASGIADRTPDFGPSFGPNFGPGIHPGFGPDMTPEFEVRHSPGIPSLFPLFGVVAVVGGIIYALISYGKAGSYEQAEREYQKRRSELTRESPPKAPPPEP